MKPYVVRWSEVQRTGDNIFAEMRRTVTVDRLCDAINQAQLRQGAVILECVPVPEEIIAAEKELMQARARFADLDRLRRERGQLDRQIAFLEGAASAESKLAEVPQAAKEQGDGA